jgi:hypothetical protein
MQAPQLRTDNDQYRQWSTQAFPPTYQKMGKCPCYIGNFVENCCKTKPPIDDISLLQPGADGSRLDQSTTTSKPFDPDERAEMTTLDEPLLEAVADFVAQRLLHKLFHSQSIKSYNRSLRAYLNDKYVESSIKVGIRKYAPNHNRGVSFLQRMGAQVSLYMIDNHIHDIIHFL